MKGECKILPTLLFALAFLILFKPTLSATLHYFGLPEHSIYMDYFIVCAIAFLSFSCLIVSLVGPGNRSLFLYMFLMLCCFTATGNLLNPGSGMVRIASSLFIEGPAIEAWAVDWASLFSSVALVIAFYKWFPRELVWGCYLAAAVYLVLNMYSALQPDFINGSRNNLFFGYRNVTFRVAIPAFTCSLAIAYGKRGTWAILPVATYLVGLLQVTVAYSATSFCAVVVMGAAALITTVVDARKFFNVLSYTVGFFIITIALVIFRVQYYIAPIINFVLHKDATFTGRTELWDESMEQIDGLGLFLGYGNNYYGHALYLDGVAQAHAHNDLLNILMLGGIFALICFILLFILAGKVLYKYRRFDISAAFSVGVLGFYVIAITEVGLSPGLFFVLAGSYCLVPMFAEREAKLRLAAKERAKAKVAAENGANGWWIVPWMRR